jgi:hypothetical protein
MLETSHAGTNRIGFEGTLSATHPLYVAPLFHPTGPLKHIAGEISSSKRVRGHHQRDM